MKNQWFGVKPWGRICEGLEHIATPVGKFCLHCEEVIGENDDGEMIGSMDGLAPVHRDCLIRMMIGSVGHQDKRCSCYGGNDEDPPGTTKRQAAAFAADYFDGGHPWPKHLDGYQECLKGARGRFAGVPMTQMYKKMCEVGKPLYKDYIMRHSGTDVSRE